MTKVIKRLRKPGEFETMLWDGTVPSAMAIVDWMYQNGVDENVGWGVNHYDRASSYFTVPTLEGKVQASPGSLIVKGVDNEFWPVADGIWQRTYGDA